MFTNWKTTSAGLLLIIGGISALIFANHPLTQEAIMGSATSILGGIGLLFAKDNNVTGGTKQQ